MLAEELGRKIEDSQWVDLTAALAGTPSLVLPICSQLEQKKSSQPKSHISTLGIYQLQSFVPP